AGGTLVAVDAGARALLDAVGVEARRAESDEESDRDERLAEALKGREARTLERWEAQVPGTILPVRLDPAHPLAFGAGAAGDPSRMYVLSGGNGFEPDAGFETVAYFPEDLHKVSGVISDENLERLDRSAWLVEKRLGGGRVVLFADDPLFRMFWRSAFQLYVNALLLAPAF
ncbi:MAG: hypothetical protein D6701_09925, partial [Gemmatimonadetes bacterium]